MYIIQGLHWHFMNSNVLEWTLTLNLPFDLFKFILEIYFWPQTSKSLSTSKGGWFFGWLSCDIWLAVDYVASNASVLNLLIICIDRFVRKKTPLSLLVTPDEIILFRYLSVNYPIKYRNKRKLLHVQIAMAGAWIISAILWAPWVLFWQFITGQRTVPENDCYIQFIWDSKLMTILTAAGKSLNLNRGWTTGSSWFNWFEQRK